MENSALEPVNEISALERPLRYTLKAIQNFTFQQRYSTEQYYALTSKKQIWKFYYWVSKGYQVQGVTLARIFIMFCSFASYVEMMKA